MSILEEFIILRRYYNTIENRNTEDKDKEKDIILKS